MTTKASTKTILSRMNDLETEDVPKKLFEILYGPPGGGKTTLAMWIAQLIKGKGRILYLDSSDGWVSLLNTPKLTQGVARYQIQSSTDLPVIANALKLNAAGFEDITVVILDEGSSVADDILMRKLRERLDIGPDESPETGPTWDDYNPAQVVFTDIMRKFHALDQHVIVLAHTKDKTNNKGELLFTGAGFRPGVMSDINKWVHHIGYVAARSKKVDGEAQYERWVQSHPTTLLMAKTRIGGLGLRDDFATVAKTVSGWIKGRGVSETDDRPVVADPDDAEE